MNMNELIGAIAAGLIAGIVLAFVEKQFPTSGIGKV